MPLFARDAIFSVRVLVRTSAVAFGAACITYAGCGTSAVGVDACRRIEKARCESAAACGVSLERPLHASPSAETDVASCIRYYDEACLHGLVGPKTEPSSAETNACVQAIISGACSEVTAPQRHPACSFLMPPEPPAIDASADAAVDASTDGGQATPFGNQ